MMNTRPINKNNPKNIYCDHCEYYDKSSGDYYKYCCTCADSMYYKKHREYYCRCKQFEWKKAGNYTEHKNKIPLSDKDRVFQILCNHSCSVMDGWVPYPSTCITGSLGWKLSYVRKLLKQLKQDGLIDSDLYVETGAELDRPILVRGYVLTPAGMKTELYRVAYEEERAICKKCFNFDIGPIKEPVSLADKNIIDFLE